METIDNNKFKWDINIPNSLSYIVEEISIDEYYFSNNIFAIGDYITTGENRTIYEIKDKKVTNNPTRPVAYKLQRSIIDRNVVGLEFRKCKHTYQKAEEKRKVHLGSLRSQVLEIWNEVIKKEMMTEDIVIMDFSKEILTPLCELGKSLDKLKLDVDKLIEQLHIKK